MPWGATRCAEGRRRLAARPPRSRDPGHGEKIAPSNCCEQFFYPLGDEPGRAPPRFVGDVKIRIAARQRPARSLVEPRMPAKPAALRASPIARRTTAAEILAQLERRGSPRVRDEMLTRYGITAPRAFGVKVGELQRIAKPLAPDHDLALALWKTGWYEARMLMAFLGDPERVTPAEMERLVRDFDNWALPDTLCFKLWDRSPPAWSKVAPWCRRREEFVRRAGFALLGCLALHDREAPDARFLQALPLIERGATDERNFVKKGVSWALRGIGHRNAKLRAAALELAKRLAESDDATARWVGRDALRDLERAAVRKKTARKRAD
jgi:3-methyladenine DNA glycosylase AlkD